MDWLEKDASSQSGGLVEDVYIPTHHDRVVGVVVWDKVELDKVWRQLALPFTLNSVSSCQKRRVHGGLFAMSRLGLNCGIFPSVSTCCCVSMMDLQFYSRRLVSRRINVIC